MKLNDMFKRVEIKERRFRAGDIIKISKDVPFQFFDFMYSGYVYYPLVKTEGELGKINRIFKLEIGDWNIFNYDTALPLLMEKLLDFKDLPSNIKTNVEYRIRNNPNRKIYIVHFIFTFKDKVSEHRSQIEAFGTLVADDMVLANEKEKEIFNKMEEDFVSRKVAEAL